MKSALFAPSLRSEHVLCSEHSDATMVAVAGIVKIIALFEVNDGCLPASPRVEARTPSSRITAFQATPRAAAGRKEYAGHASKQAE
jgi:predicted dinucleotide-binding enzyme